MLKIYSKQTMSKQILEQTDSGRMEIRANDVKGERILGQTNIHLA